MNEDWMVTLVLCQTCLHDFRYEDPYHGLIASFCKKGCKEYDPYRATECNVWEAKH